MKLKKFAALLLAAAMVMGMAACTKDPAQSGAGGNNDANTQTTGDKKDDGNKDDAGEDGKQEDGTANADTLVLGTSADFAPYEYHKMMDGKDTILGFDVALARQIAADLGKELVIKDMDFGNLLTELQNGTVDLVAAGLSPTEERKKEVDFSEPYYFGDQCCIIRAEDQDKYKSTADFKGQSLAAQVNSIQEGWAHDHHHLAFIDGEVHLVQGHDAGAKLLHQIVHFDQMFSGRRHGASSFRDKPAVWMPGMSCRNTGQPPAAGGPWSGM